MRDLSIKRTTRTYLEIGVAGGELLQHIHAETAICVDPVYGLNRNIMQNKDRVFLFKMTSDAFFRDEVPLKFSVQRIDLAFLDGLHVFEFLLRDFYNTEALCGSGSLIVLHDCLPLNVEMAHRDSAEAVRMGRETAYPDYWTGDVWKLVPILQQYRPDLRLVCVDAPPSGLVLVSGVDPSSTVLRERYLEIVDSFRAVPNDRAGIESMYAGIEILPAAAIMTGQDHSLYLRT